MAFQVFPQEFHVLADRYVIRTRVPVADLTDEMLLLRVRNANLAAGDCVTVQCMSHEYDQLLHEAEYRVVSRKDALRVQQVSDHETRQINDVSFLICRKGAWWASPLVKDEQQAPASDAAAPIIKWNAGKQAHEVIGPDGTVLRAFKKDDGGKAAAEAFLASTGSATPKAA